MPRLHRAAASGSGGKIKQYLNAGDNINSRDADGRTALLSAVHAGHIDACVMLLAAGADPSISDNEKCFPLYIAVQEEHIAIATALIGANVDMDAVVDRPDGGTALFYGGL